MVLLVSPLASGLFSATMYTPGLASGLADGLLPKGIILSGRIVAQMVRVTLANLTQRRNWKRDGYVLPHVTRKRFIEKMVGSFAKQQHTPARTLFSLFRGLACSAIGPGAAATARSRARPTEGAATSPAAPTTIGMTLSSIERDLNAAETDDNDPVSHV